MKALKTAEERARALGLHVTDMQIGQISLSWIQCNYSVAVPRRCRTLQSDYSEGGV